ncbi:autotransporter outer membrane beta-barrel domain-containing protein [Achromobacter mucicolens]|uniref:autotransporter family protein n=1 Tax=Achromobacter mucicolens TaxID=1389922 RepID=UPI00142DAF81|nr:autotransporter outer membrane beta-barrel domain-containing protein [Achromobacter mucicolens]
MSRRFPLTRIAVLLSLSLPFSAPSAFAQPVDYNLLGGIESGDIVNTGTGTYTSITVEGNSLVEGSIINNATLWPAQYSQLGGITVQASTINGSIVNEAGKILTSNRAGLSLTDGAVVKGDIHNKGQFGGSYGLGVGIEVLSSSSVVGKIINDGTLTAGIVVSGGSVGGIVNNGTLSAKIDGIAIDVMNAATPLTIVNAGTIQGDVMLGTSTLDIAGGTITGSVVGPSAIMNINGDFGATSKISVGQINVAPAATLTLNGNTMKGLVNVKGTLAGSGEVGPTTMESGSTLSPNAAAQSNHIFMMSVTPVVVTPPSPIGTITVNGDLTFKPGSTYRVDATADGKSDRVKVIGTANLAGSVVHVGSGGTYAESTAYTILSATSLNGHFDSASSDMAYLQPSLSHQGNQVVLTLDRKQVSAEPDSQSNGNTGNTGGNTGAGTRPIEFADLAVTGNQRSAANALQSLPKTSSLYTRVLNLPNGAPAGVFADLSGESFGSSVSAMQNVSNNVASLPTAQLRANMNAGFVPGPPTAQVGRGDASMLPRSNAQPLWAQAFGNWRTMDGNGDVAKSRERDVGIFVGGDHGVGNGWRLGGAFGYTDSRITVDDRSAKSDVNSYSAILYGGKSFEAGSGKINFTAGVAYTWHDIDSKRNVNAAGQYQELKANYSASTGQVFTDVGYAIALNDRVTLEPFFGADFSDLRTRGFSESGGDAALSGKSSTNNVGTTTLGLRAQTTFDVKDTAGRLRGMLGWRHAYGDVNPQATMSFDGSQPFTVAGNPLARDAAVMEVGVDLAMSKNATLGLAYSGQFGDGNRQNTGTVNVSWRF